MWIQQYFSRVEPMPVQWVVRTIDPVSVELSGLAVRQIAVPDIVCPLRELATHCLFFTLCFVEKAKLNTFCIMGIQGKVNALPVPEGAERIRVAGINCHR